MNSYGWLASLIEVNNLKEQLIIGDVEQEVLKKIVNVNGEIDGGILYATDNLFRINGNVSLCSTKINDIFVNLQLKNINPKLVFVNKKIDDLDDLVNLINGDVILVVEKSICDCFEVLDDVKKVIETSNCCFFVSKNNSHNDHYFMEIENRIAKIERLEIKNKDVITVGIGLLTYNHEKYIEECLSSIYKQKGPYKLKLFIINDASTDDTKGYIESFLEKNTKNNISVKFINNEKNVGMITNMKKLIEFFSETDYFTFCEGDDFWLSNERISKMVDFMSKNREVSVAFNDLMIYDDNNLKYFNKHLCLEKTYFDTRDLIRMENFIGNFSCCFYNTSYLKYLNKEIYDGLMYDFLFNVEYSRYGFIGRVNEALSVYRYHNNSLWHSKKDEYKAIELYKCIDDYNKISNFLYDVEYSEYQCKIVREYNFKKKVFFKDLMIIDNVFPSEYSQFTYQEITSYLENFENSICFASGASLVCFNNNNLDLELYKYYVRHPEMIYKLKRYNLDCVKLYKSKCAYFIFLSTLRMFFDYVIDNKIPFVFELYPGGGMVFENDECDAFLKKVMSSKYFKKVIVTQRPVMDYLIKKDLCKKEKIEYIFGVVMPMRNDFNSIVTRKNYGINKKKLDIVFMAHKYTKNGVDKGYDVFTEVMKILCNKYKNINVHVVGGFTEEDIDVSSFKEQIYFYGELTGSQFDAFFSDKDMILSPNIPNKIFEGSFDGFPTASCTEAGLRKTAIFCTDPLGMNDNIFIDGKEIVIVKHDVDDILEKVEYYYKNFKELKEIGENCFKRILDVYSYENQIQPRIEVINEVIGSDKKLWRR